MNAMDSEYWDNETGNLKPIYYDAFHNQEYEVWGGTKFSKDLSEITYYHALMCFISETPDTEIDRRLLLRSYLKPDFSYNEDIDTLNQAFPKLPTDNSYITRILRNLCYIYNTKPYRVFLLGETENEKISKKISDLLTKMKYDWHLQKIYRLAKFVNEVAVRPLRRNGKLTLDIVAPDSYRTVYDDFGALLELWIPFPMVINGKLEQCFNVWTQSTYRVSDAKGRFISFQYALNNKIINGDSEGIKNPYGKIPYVFLKLNDSLIYGGAMYELLKSQLFCNKLSLLADENITFNGFSMYVATNLAMKGSDKIKISPRHVFNITDAVANEVSPIPPSLDTINPSAQYDQIQAYKESFMKSALKNLGLPISMIEPEGASVTGIGILRERQELTDAQEEDKTVLVDFENELINLITEIENIEVKREYPVVTVDINYGDIKALEEPSVMFETEKAKFEYGLIPARDFVSQFTDKELSTDQEAIDFLKTNRDLLKTIRLEDGTETGETLDGISGSEVTSGSQKFSSQTSTAQQDNTDDLF